jgi:peroxiredoxin
MVLYATLGVLAIALIATVAVLSRNPETVPQSATDAPSIAPLKVGEQAPDFSVSTTDGPFSLSEAQKKPVLLEVFATWCPHCQRETRVLNNLFDAYSGRFNLVAVSGSANGRNGTEPESQADVVRFAQDFSVRYPVAFDPDLTVAHQYLQGGFPTVVLIGKDRTIRSINSGEVPYATLRADLEKALKEN